jgi:ABC-2 type transport system ATP-binding protein
VLKRIGYCPARGVLHPDVTAFDWVRYLIELQGFSASDAKQRAEQSLYQVGLAHALHRQMGGYSRGMQQRVKLAQAVAHEPELLILDEPFNGLDPIGRHKMTELLREWTRGGRSLLFASHILHEVEAVSPAFLLICNGRLLASGSAEDVHRLMAELPSEIRIRASAPHDLARRLAGETEVETLRVRDGELAVSTRSPMAIYQKLPGWVAETGIRVEELRSSDESLQTLFDSLLRIHRGES